MTPGIARTFSTSALMKAMRRSKSCVAKQRRLERQEPFAPDPEIGIAQVLKRLQEQTAAGQQHDGERRLDDDQRVLEPVAARARGAASAVA